MANPVNRLITLGRVSCTKYDSELTSLTAQPRRVMLLVYLALAEPRGFQSRDRLVSLFWPEHDEARARNALSQAVHFLRRSLSADALVNGSDDLLRLHPDAVWCDAVAFEAAMAAGRVEEAIALYHGRFLDGFHITAAAPELDQWAAAQRDRLGHLHQRALRLMAQRHEDAGDCASAVVWHRELVGVDPLSSRAVLGLMRALVAAGEPEDALQHARIHETLIREELQAAPDTEIASLVQQIRNRSTPPTATGRANAKAVARVALSGVALAKTCRRFRIALPRRASWQHTQARQPVKLTKLPMPPAKALQERQRHFKEEERQRKYNEWLAYAEKRRREAIQDVLNVLRMVNELRTYVALRRSHVPDRTDTLEEWLTWVAQYADRLENEVLTHTGPRTETFNEYS